MRDRIVDFTTIQVPVVPAFEFANSDFLEIHLSAAMFILEPGLFSNCTDLKAVTIPSMVSIIPDFLFNQCPSLTTINIGNVFVLQNNVLSLSVSEIGEYSFAEVKFNTLIISNSVFLRNNSFRSSSVVEINLKTIDIEFHGLPFAESYRITNVIIPDNTNCISLDHLPINTIFRNTSISSRKWEEFNCVASSSPDEVANSTKSSGISGGYVVLFMFIGIVIGIVVALIGLYIIQRVRSKNHNDKLFTNLLDA